MNGVKEKDFVLRWIKQPRQRARGQQTPGQLDYGAGGWNGSDDRYPDATGWLQSFNRDSSANTLLYTNCIMYAFCVTISCQALGCADNYVTL